MIINPFHDEEEDHYQAMLKQQFNYGWWSGFWVGCAFIIFSYLIGQHFGWWI